ncbi:putative ABC transport system ATP-binding protein [Paraoerskovia marina]|uniref:Putative ABC transport system ATP-binding protein n=1 Tax=Paraoerskovia marina TaxID=545619 RepID=A0A1H1NZG6_9CELL|nr:ABC transporter ATP-binding protein [Paraoerskovia marina]SDS04381.1 putative ABC transport system ATP-binding protein [Paraoerskovia marina]
MTVIELAAITRTYAMDPPVEALRGVSLVAHEGESLAIVGRSGSGKSTLLNILGMLDEPTSGVYRLLGRDTQTLSGAARDRFRASSLGFVFQDSHVLGHRTAAENLWLRLALAGVARSQRASLVEEALARVGLSHRSESPGRLLSGGEKQRLAVARAVITRPQVLLADEPTGNLDVENGAAVLDLFAEQAATGVAVLMITHDVHAAAWADHRVELDDGYIRSDGTRR